MCQYSLSPSCCVHFNMLLQKSAGRLPRDQHWTGVSHPMPEGVSLWDLRGRAQSKTMQKGSAAPTVRLLKSLKTTDLHNVGGESIRNAHYVDCYIFRFLPKMLLEHNFSQLYKIIQINEWLLSISPPGHSKSQIIKIPYHFTIVT